MHILSLKATTRGQEALLTFSDNSTIIFNLDDVVRLSLAKYQELSPEKIKEIYQFSLKFLLTKYALRQIAISPKTEKIITSKLNFQLKKLLQKYPYPKSDYSFLISSLVDYLKSQNLLNQNDYITHFIKSHPRYSSIKIKGLLQAQGLVVNDAPTSDKAKILNILQKKYLKSQLADFPTKNKIIGRFYRQGFSLSDIKSAFDDYSQND